MDIVKKFLKTSIELENYYYNFWKKIYNNDAYILGEPRFPQTPLLYFYNLRVAPFKKGLAYGELIYAIISLKRNFE